MIRRPASFYACTHAGPSNRIHSFLRAPIRASDLEGNARLFLSHLLDQGRTFVIQESFQELKLAVVGDPKVVEKRL
jgi:hypothetical protein